MKFKPLHVILAGAQLATALWPVPRQVSTGQTILEIDRMLSVTYNNHTLFWSGQTVDSSNLQKANIVQGAVARTFNAIFQTGFVPYMLHPPGSDFEPSRDQMAGRVSRLTIQDAGNNDTERYSLRVDSGEAVIKAESTVAVLRALETFTQLFNEHSSGGYWYTNLAPVEIEDEPVFPHRGLIFDISREWYTVDNIKHVIDSLAMAKMNKMHLIATNTQSWQLEIPAFPELTGKGIFYKGQGYSPQDIADMYTYGVSRGVEVIMEIDMPGHSNIQSIYPELGVAYMAKPYDKYCNEPPCGSFRLNSTKVEAFLEKMFEDLLPRLSPYSSHFHTGGDEYNANNCALDPDIRSGDVGVVQPLMERFVKHAHGIIRKHGLTPIVWEETIKGWNLTLPKDTIVQSWRGGATPELAEAGYKVIDSSSAYYYLNCGRGGFVDFQDGPELQKAYPFADWCAPAKNWRVIYMHTPTDGVDAKHAENVLGGEVAIFSETVDAASMDVILWPRAAAAAEIWWSGRKDGNGTDRSVWHARPRLSEMRHRMLARGVTGATVIHKWCEQHALEECTAGYGR